MVELFANSGDPDQTPRSAASDLGLHYLQVTRLEVASLRRLIWVCTICKLPVWRSPVFNGLNFRTSCWGCMFLDYLGSIWYNEPTVFTLKLYGTTVFLLNIRTYRPEQTVYTQNRRCRTLRLIKIYTVCHSSSSTFSNTLTSTAHSRYLDFAYLE